MNSIHRNVLLQMIPSSRRNERGSEIMDKIRHYSIGGDEDFGDFGQARQAFGEALRHYTKCYSDVYIKNTLVPISHTEFRVISDAAKSVVSAMEELARFDNTIASDIGELKAAMAPLLGKRAEIHRAERLQRSSNTVQR